MEGFRLLAIKTGSKALARDDSAVGEINFFKVLKENTLYRFCNEYDYHYDENENIDSIAYNFSVPKDLYFIEQGDRKLPVYFSSVVGRNGSGKSSLVELIFAAVYNLSIDYKILEIDEDGEELKKIVGLDVEIFYTIDGNIYGLRIDPTLETTESKTLSGNFVIYKETNQEEGKRILGSRMFNISTILEDKIAHFKNFFFYTIAINYSHYALNSRNIGTWIDPLFHKNDGYQTPVVLNPFRDKGKIDVNIEAHLTKSRIISNLLTRNSKDELLIRELVKGKIAQNISFKLNRNKGKFKADDPIGDLITSHQKDILDEIFRVFGKPEFANVYTDENYTSSDPNLITGFKYLLSKAYSISQRYHPYTKEEFQFISIESSNKTYKFDLEVFKLFLTELYQDAGHVTFKFRQAINFILHYSDYKDLINRTVYLEVLSKAIYLFKENEQIVYLIPPSFFNSDIGFSDGSRFSELSSGETQQIFSEATYMYHLINLNSVARNDLYRYQYVNLVFDEIELYYHPDLQKEFVKNLLDSLSRLNLNNIKGINCLLITHSPFILSDIPSQNILHLRDGDVAAISSQPTFGANIHDLLANDFFMSDGFMGSWAKEKINSVVAFLNFHKLKKTIIDLNSEKGELEKEKEKEIENEIKVLENKMARLKEAGFIDDPKYNQALINLVGERIIRYKLEAMFDDIFPKEKSEAKEQILNIARNAGLNIEFKQNDE